MQHAMPSDTHSATAHAGPWHIGLTGGIGSGKSTVACWLAQAGAVVLDADAIVHTLTGPHGAAMPAITAQFGAHMADSNGALHRAAMRALVFQQPQARQALEAIIHPLVQHTIQQQVDSACAQQPAPVLVYDIPLLAESPHWQQRMQHIVVVDCDEETQVRRVMQRSQLSAEQVRAIMTQQASRAQRLALADAVIHNGAETTLEALYAQVRHWARPFGLHLPPHPPSST